MRPANGQMMHGHNNTSQLPPISISRSDALLSGERLFFSGKPCRRGHIAHRHVRNYACVECQREWYSSNKEHVKLRSRRYRSDPVNRAKHNASSLRSYRENPSKGIANAKKHRDANPEVHREYAKRHVHKHKAERKVKLETWRAANPEKRRLQNHRRRALERAAIDSLESSDILRVYEDQGGKCAGPHCRIDMGKRYTIDHKTPLFLGGHNTPDNIKLLCKSCNSSKGYKTMEEWLLMRPANRTASIVCQLV